MSEMGSDFSNIIKKAQTPMKGQKIALERNLRLLRGKKKDIRPDWWGAIKQGRHGSGKDQKKLWTIVSEYVRKRDWKKGCVSCGRAFESWEQSQAGHYIPWSTCHGMYKYDVLNLAAQCMFCNAWGGGKAGHGFADELVRRHGPDIINVLDYNNEQHRGEKLTLEKIVELGVSLHKVNCKLG